MAFFNRPTRGQQPRRPGAAAVRPIEALEDRRLMSGGLGGGGEWFGGPHAWASGPAAPEAHRDFAPDARRADHGFDHARADGDPGQPTAAQPPAEALLVVAEPFRAPDGATVGVVESIYTVYVAPPAWHDGPGARPAYVEGGSDHAAAPAPKSDSAGEAYAEPEQVTPAPLPPDAGNVASPRLRRRADAGSVVQPQAAQPDASPAAVVASDVTAAPTLKPTMPSSSPSTATGAGSGMSFAEMSVVGLAAVGGQAAGAAAGYLNQFAGRMTNVAVVAAGDGLAATGTPAAVADAAERGALAGAAMVAAVDASAALPQAWVGRVAAGGVFLSVPHFDGAAAFGDALAAFAAESASLRGIAAAASPGEAPAVRRTTAWLTTAAVVGLDAVVAAYWYAAWSRQRRARQALAAAEVPGRLTTVPLRRAAARLLPRRPRA